MEAPASASASAATSVVPLAAVADAAAGSGIEAVLPPNKSPPSAISMRRRSIMRHHCACACVPPVQSTWTGTAQHSTLELPQSSPWLQITGTIDEHSDIQQAHKTRRVKGRAPSLESRDAHIEDGSNSPGDRIDRATRLLAGEPVPTPHAAVRTQRTAPPRSRCRGASQHRQQWGQPALSALGLHCLTSHASKQLRQMARRCCDLNATVQRINTTWSSRILWE